MFFKIVDSHALCSFALLWAVIFRTKAQKCQERRIFKLVTKGKRVYIQITFS